MAQKYTIHECDHCGKVEMVPGNVLPEDTVYLSSRTNPSVYICSWDCVADFAAAKAGYSFVPEEGSHEHAADL